MTLRWYLPLLAGLAAYAIAPFGDLVWDDQLVRQQVYAFGSLADVFRPPDGIPQWTYAYYRPLTALSYLLDARLFGPAASFGPHAFNVACHLVATACVWLLLRHCLAGRAQGEASATLLAALFAAHPIHTEAVSWITGRSDLLATMLLVPAVLAGLRWQSRGGLWALAASGLLFLLALLAKEVALAGLGILPLALLVAGGRVPGSPAQDAVPRDRWLAAGALLACWAVVAAAYFSLRAAAGATVGTLPAPALGQLAPALAWYLVKLVLPWPQSNFVVPALLPTAAVTVAVLAAAGVAAVAGLVRWRTAGDGATALGVGWVLLALAPALAATALGVAETPVAERSLYLPSVGFVLALGPALCALLATRRARAASGVALALIGVALLGSWARGAVWLDDLRLWESAVRQAPSHGLPWLALGKARFEAGDVPGALTALVAARDLQDDPLGRAIAHYNLGTVQLAAGQIAEAEASFTAAVRAAPDYAQGHYGLGRVLHERAVAGNVGEARRLALLERSMVELEIGLRHEPRSVQIHLMLAMSGAARGELLARAGRPVEAAGSHAAAVGHLDAVAALDPAVAAIPEVGALRTRAVAGARGAASP